jgi:hypothetical protein
MLQTIETAPTHTHSRTAIALLGALLAFSASAFAQATNPPGSTPSGPRVTSTAKLEPGAPPSYDNKWEVYGGLSFMNGQAGQNIPVRYNMGGGEVMGTYWLGRKLGVAADYRFEAGTTPIFPNPYYKSVLVTQNIFAGGVQYRGPKNRYMAIDFHALGGGSNGKFDSAIQGFPGGSPISATGIGLYPNKTAPWGAAGGSIDFNYSHNLAIRFSPDLIFEHFGTETREFFSASAGVMYRFGKK